MTKELDYISALIIDSMSQIKHEKDMQLKTGEGGKEDIEAIQEDLETLKCIKLALTEHALIFAFEKPKGDATLIEWRKALAKKKRWTIKTL
tara:strand:+ start:1051 stop:1323 length:273 start_codon:yes stop_codon:yes gene_type:complete